MFTKTTLDEIRERTSMSSLIGERIPVKRAGRNFKALCPFHQEKTPSFSINDEKGIYHCFGCGAGGDCFQFLMQFDGIGFAEAVETLARRAGVSVERDRSPAMAAAEQASSKRRRMLLRANEIARDFFSARLADPAAGAAARDYLKSRGIEGEIIKQHFLGCADKSWDSLARHLESKGVPVDLAVELGLLKPRTGGGHYDFFRERLMFPIISPRGEVIAFGGRALSGEKAQEAQAKYLNSPDSPVYHKSGSVYGLDRSAGAIRAQDQAVLVEGYMDFIALHQSGICNVAAPLGTSLTEGHVFMIARYTRNIVLVFDGDEAGSRAAFRALGIFMEAGIMPRVAALPAGDDPDSFVRREGAEALRAKIDAAQPLFDRFVESVVAETGLDSAGKAAAVQRIAPVLRKVGDEADASILRQHVSRRLDVDESAMASALKAGGPRQQGLPPKGRRACETDPAADSSPERMLIRALVAHPELADETFRVVSPRDFVDGWCRRAAELLAGASSGGAAPDIREILAGVEDKELAGWLRAMALENPFGGKEEASAAAADCAGRIADRPEHARIGMINEEIVRAQNEGDEERILSLLAEKGSIVGRIHGRARTGDR